MSEASQAAGAWVGATLDGSYRIERLLGEGGMGAVYHATQLRLGKPVAVKVMAREVSAASDLLARFHREALVTSNLGHPNIVQVFDFSTTPTGEPYLVMEFLDGEDLDRRLRRERRLSPGTALHIVKQVGAALMATHGKDIVHRDLKPANIYLLKATGAGDFVKVLDFGISKVRSATTKLTRTASIMGTPGYMSPEQAKGRIEDIDEKTDQWALACITWECLAGEPPFQGESPLSTLFQVVNESPPPLAPRVPGLRPQVEEVLLHALAKDKKDRFPSIAEFIEALEGAVTGATASAQTSVSPTMRLPETAVDMRPTEKPAKPTTFTQTAGEVDGELARARVRSRIWIGAATGVAAILLIGGFLLLRARPVSQPGSMSPPPAAPAPVAAPLPAPAPVVLPGASAAKEVPAPPSPPAESPDDRAPETDRPSVRAPESKRRLRSAVPAEPASKRARPARRPSVPRMIEDL